MYEEYRDIPGYEGLYRISCNGDIVSYNGPGKNPRLRAHTVYDGRHYIRLSKGNSIKNFPVATLVAQTFKVPNPDNHKIVMMKDGNPDNLNVDNLYWGTYNPHSPESDAKRVETMKKRGYKALKMAHEKIRRKVSAYDDDGNWIATFRGIADANRIMGVEIGQALIHGCRAGGYYWKYEDERKY